MPKEPETKLTAIDAKAVYEHRLKLADILLKSGYPDTPAAMQAGLELFLSGLLMNHAQPTSLMDHVVQLVINYVHSFGCAEQKEDLSTRVHVHHAGPISKEVH
jgi:hypothetical protein